MQLIQHIAMNAPGNLSIQQYGPFHWLNQALLSWKQKYFQTYQLVGYTPSAGIEPTTT
jgi:hypothetical protein